MPLRPLVGLFHRLFGELPRARPPEPGSGPLVAMVVVFACLGMMLGEHHELPKGSDAMARGAYRLLVHLVPSLAAVATWELIARGRDRVLGVGFLLLCLLALAPRAVQVDLLVQHGAGVAAASLALYALLLALLRRVGVSAGDWMLGLGDLRWWGPRVGALIGLLVPGIAAAVLLSPALAAYYPTGMRARKSWEAFGELHLSILLDFIGWEYMFRGLLLAALMRRGDPVAAILLSAIPFFLLHGGKPSLELVSSLFGGMLAGWFCLRAGSFWPMVLVHISMITLTGLFAQLLRMWGGG